MALNLKNRFVFFSLNFFARFSRSGLWAPLCIVFFYFPSLFARENLSFTIEHDPFLLHCADVDSSIARQAGDILSKSYEEISFDLKIHTKQKFQVYVMPTRKSFLRALEGNLPNWTGAFAVPSQHLMVVKSPRWNPSDNFKIELIHELVHLLVHSELGMRDLPRWLDEGIAIFYSGENRWKTDVAVSKALATGSIIPLSEIDDVLQYHRAKADLAYQQSFSAVYYLLATYDVEALRGIISALKEGSEIHKAFYQATGSNLDDFEKEWQAYIKKTHRWLWIYEINNYLWGFILLLAILVFVLRIFRNRRIERQWQNDDLHFPDNDIDEP